MRQYRLSWRWFVLPVALGAFAPIACEDSGLIEIVVPPGKPSDAGNLPDSEWFDGGMDGDPQTSDAANPGTFPVLVGITPSPKGDGPPSIGDVVDARLKAISSGSRAVVVRRSPAELTTDAAWAELASELSMYEKNEVLVHFVFAVVDGKARGLEPALSGLAWDDSTVLKPMFPRIDQIVVKLGSNAKYFIFGRDVDVYLAAHEDERGAFENYLSQLMSYVRMNSPEMRLGVGFSFAGATIPDPSWEKTLEGSDVAACSYLPGLGSDAAGLANNIATDADTLVAHAAGKPIVIEALGYPSSDVVGGSDAKQALFLKTFFTVLAPRRSNFAFVNVEALHDLAPTRCADRAMFVQEPTDGVWAAYACSLGLFAADGQPKSSWEEFVIGAAVFASP